ncbi:hypothetical protein BT69DRAFT_1328493 [Atractiella rhizophila]|nr:hypothetical protein BT69DRAFT_1328493 [Atractiella rhizophila]
MSTKKRSPDPFYNDVSDSGQWDSEKEEEEETDDGEIEIDRGEEEAPDSTESLAHHSLQDDLLGSVYDDLMSWVLPSLYTTRDDTINVLTDDEDEEEEVLSPNISLAPSPVNSLPPALHSPTISSTWNTSSSQTPTTSYSLTICTSCQTLKEIK